MGEFTLDIIKKYFFAVRPWTWTASVVPLVLVSTLLSDVAVTDTATNTASMSYLDKTIRLLLMFICVQSGGNAINTVEDYKCGVDHVDQVGGCTVLVNKVLSVEGLRILGYMLIGLASAIAVQLGFEVNSGSYEQLMQIFVTGIFLTIAYTAWPFRLKYRALGDIVIFVCFGPLLMQFCAIILTGRIQQSLYIYSFPIGMLTEAILHANNTRDIDGDKKAGIKTLAINIGFEGCRIFYYMLVFAAYASIAYLQLTEENHKGLILVMLSLPVAKGCFDSFTREKIGNLDEQTAQFHLLFGLLAVIGLKISPTIESLFFSSKS